MRRRKCLFLRPNERCLTLASANVQICADGRACALCRREVAVHPLRPVALDADRAWQDQVPCLRQGREALDPVWPLLLECVLAFHLWITRIGLRFLLCGLIAQRCMVDGQLLSC